MDESTGSMIKVGPSATFYVVIRGRAATKLVLEGVKPTPAGVRRGYDYRLYANLPQFGGDHGTYYIGQINSCSEGLMHGHHGVEISFDLGNIIDAQKRERLWSDDGVRVSFLSDDERPETLITIDTLRAE